MSKAKRAANRRLYVKASYYAAVHYQRLALYAITNARAGKATDFS